MGKSERIDGLPTEDELMQLPRWARVAFAARCAERVRPLFRHYWADAPEEYVRAVDEAVTLAKRAATASRRDGRFRAAVRVAAAAADGAANAAEQACNYADSASVSAAFAASFAADAAFQAPSRRTRPGHVADAVGAASSAARIAGVGTYTNLAMRRDFALLSALAEREGWTDETAVDPDLLGPLWAEGEPEGWPEDAREERAGDSTFAVRFEFPDGTPRDEIVAYISEFTKRMDALAKSSGVSGIIPKRVDARRGTRIGVPS